MPNEMAVLIVTQLKQQLVQLVRTMAQALDDGRVSPLEGLALSLQGTTFATGVLTLLQGLTPEVRKDLLYVLEVGEWMLPTLPQSFGVPS